MLIAIEGNEITDSVIEVEVSIGMGEAPTALLKLVPDGFPEEASWLGPEASVSVTFHHMDSPEAALSLEGTVVGWGHHFEASSGGYVSVLCEVGVPEGEGRDTIAPDVDTLASLTVTHTSSENVGSAVLLGCDCTLGQTLTLQDLPFPLKEAKIIYVSHVSEGGEWLTYLSFACESNQAEHTDILPINLEEQASSYDLMHVDGAKEGSLVLQEGLELAPGALVSFGFEAPLDGEWEVAEVIHTFSAEGWQTVLSFSADDPE